MTTKAKPIKMPEKPVSQFFKAMLDAGLVGCVSGPGDAARKHDKYLRMPRAKKKAAA